MKKTVVIIAISLVAIVVLFGSCGAQKTSTKPTKVENALLPDLPKNIEFSIGFRMFWDDLRIETQGMTTLEGYEPSQKMISDNNLVVLPNGKYGIKGFIQVTLASFDVLQFEQIGGNETYFADGIYTFTMPLEALPKMIELKGIVQIEMSQKVYKKRY